MFLVKSNAEGKKKIKLEKTILFDGMQKF